MISGPHISLHALVWKYTRNKLCKTMPYTINTPILWWISSYAMNMNYEHDLASLEPQNPLRLYGSLLLHLRTY